MKTKAAYEEGKPIRTTELGASVGQLVEVRGWVHATRALGQITFLVVRDGYGTVQAVVPASKGAGDLTPQSVVRVVGLAVEAVKAPGGVEIQVHALEVLEAVGETLPLTLSKREIAASLPTVLNHAAITLRHPTRRATFAISAAAMAGFRATMGGLGATEIQTPKLVAGATEGGANVFAVAYFSDTAYLAQSPQFYKQTMVGVFERVFEVGPVFRAEPHNTARHLCEYVSMDVEIGFIESYRDVMAVCRAAIAGTLASIEARCGPELALLGVELPVVPETIPSIEFAEAKAGLGSVGGGESDDLSPGEERAIGAWAEAEFGSPFVFVTGYPMAKRPFYTHPREGAPELSNSFDLLFRGTELVTGGQRLHRYGAYIRALESRGLSPAAFETYLQAFRYGMPPHGGFAIGLERLLMQLIGADNIREVTLFPRDRGRLSP